MSDSNGSRKKIVVLKMGGSVLTGVKAFRRVAVFLKHRSQVTPNEKLVVVVSAQKFATDRLERQARRIVRTPSVRALDLLWSTGELSSVALLALHLEALQVSSVGFNVHETGLQFSTDRQADPALPSLGEHRLSAALSRYVVVVVPGFLATRSDGAVASLGRGGSDLSAVLLAVGLQAARCELVKDVPGYFEEDPHKNPRALHIPSLSFEDAIHMAEKGCELVERRALLSASEARLPLLIRSVHERAPVTVISSRSKSGSMDLHDEPVAAQA